MLIIKIKQIILILKKKSVNQTQFYYLINLDETDSRDAEKQFT